MRTLLYPRRPCRRARGLHEESIVKRPHARVVLSDARLCSFFNPARPTFMQQAEGRIHPRLLFRFVIDDKPERR